MSQRKISKTFLKFLVKSPKSITRPNMLAWVVRFLGGGDLNRRIRTGLATTMNTINPNYNRTLIADARAILSRNINGISREDLLTQLERQGSFQLFVETFRNPVIANTFSQSEATRGMTFPSLRDPAEIKDENKDIDLSNEQIKKPEKIPKKSKKQIIKESGDKEWVKRGKINPVKVNNGTLDDDEIHRGIFNPQNQSDMKVIKPTSILPKRKVKKEKVKKEMVKKEMVKKDVIEKEIKSEEKSDDITIDIDLEGDNFQSGLGDNFLTDSFVDQLQNLPLMIFDDIRETIRGGISAEVDWFVTNMNITSNTVRDRLRVMLEYVREAPNRTRGGINDQLTKLRKKFGLSSSDVTGIRNILLPLVALKAVQRWATPQPQQPQQPQPQQPQPQQPQPQSAAPRASDSIFDEFRRQRFKPTKIKEMEPDEKKEESKDGNGNFLTRENKQKHFRKPPGKKEKRIKNDLRPTFKFSGGNELDYMMEEEFEQAEEIRAEDFELEAYSTELGTAKNNVLIRFSAMEMKNKFAEEAYDIPKWQMGAIDFDKTYQWSAPAIPLVSCSDGVESMIPTVYRVPDKNGFMQSVAFG